MLNSNAAFSSKLTKNDVQRLVADTRGYSGRDITLILWNAVVRRIRTKMKKAIKEGRKPSKNLTVDFFYNENDELIERKTASEENLLLYENYAKKLGLPFERGSDDEEESGDVEQLQSSPSASRRKTGPRSKKSSGGGRVSSGGGVSSGVGESKACSTPVGKPTKKKTGSSSRNLEPVEMTEMQSVIFHEFLDETYPNAEGRVKCSEVWKSYKEYISDEEKSVKIKKVTFQAEVRRALGCECQPPDEACDHRKTKQGTWFYFGLS